jgi:DDE superfamily endonuclease
VVDGHSSHLNMNFINLCNDRQILLMILPPHSTHQLQPLNVGCFAPLARFYTNELNKLISHSLGLNDMGKRLFLKLFWPAWRQAFTESNIISAWSKTGLFPLNLDMVLASLIKPIPPTKPEELQTPMTSRAICQFQKSFAQSPTAAKIEQLLKANERLAVECDIAFHTTRGLEEALKLEKQKQKKGVRLNLVGEEASGAQFFSPGRVECAKAFQASKNAEKQEELDLKAVKKAAAEAMRLQKKTEKEEQATKAAEQHQLAMEEKLQKTAERQALQELKAKASPTKQVSQKLKIVSTVPKTPRKHKISVISPLTEVSSVKKPKIMVSTTTRGRTVLQPRRFDL